MVMNLTTHLHVKSQLKMHEALPSYLLYKFFTALIYVKTFPELYI